MSLRSAFSLAVLACAGLLGYAYYLQFFQFLDPCPLCMVQRLVFYSLGGIFALGALHNPDRVGAWLYTALVILLAALGVAAAGRHLWLQSLPPDQVPDCGPSLEYMLESWPLADTLRSLLQASGECARVEWSFLGISMPGWTLIWYLLFAAWAVFAAVVSKPKKRHIFHGRLD